VAYLPANVIHLASQFWICTFLRNISGQPAVDPDGHRGTAGERCRCIWAVNGDSSGGSDGILVVIGRLLFAALFLVSAYGHLTRRKMMAGYAAGRGVPAAEFLVVATGVQMAVGSLMVALGVWPDLGALILFVFLILEGK